MRRGGSTQDPSGNRPGFLFALAIVLLGPGAALAASGTVCPEPGMRAYELRFVEITPAGPIEPSGSPVEALGSPALDADDLARLAQRFGGTSAVGMAWGYLLAAAPGRELNFHGDLPSPWGRRLSVHGGPGTDPTRHALSIDSAYAKTLVDLADGQTRALLVGESDKGRVVALVTAGPCGPVGLLGTAAGTCAANAVEGVTSPVLVSNPTQAKPGTHRYVNVDVQGRGLVRFVVTEAGAIRDPLLMVDRMNAAEVARALSLTLEGRQYAAATAHGQPVAYCVVDNLAPFSAPTAPRGGPTAP